MATRSAWAAACIPLALVAAVGALFAFVTSIEQFQRLMPIVLLLAVTALAWYGGRTPGLVAAAVGVLAVWGTPLMLDGVGGLIDPVPLVESAALILVALLAGSLRDARDGAELALSERDARLRLVSGQLPAILWSTDTDLRITTGMGSGGTGAGTFLAFLNIADPSSPAHLVHFDALRGISSTYEVQWRDRSYQSHLEPLRNPEGEIIGVVGVALDITERKNAEQRLHAAKELAETATRSKDRFLAMLSHELRTPLTPALIAASALKTDATLSPAARDDVEMIRRNIELEVRLIDDLLDLTRISKGKLEFRFDTEDTHPLLHGAVDICREEAARKGLKLSIEAGATAHHVSADGARLVQVFWNLLNNSVKFTPPGGRITVRTADGANGQLLVEVIDTGIGIEPDVLPHVFDAFEQGGTSVTRSFGGLGLGLAISKALIAQHGGQLVAESAGRDRGATFRVVLPTVAAPEQIAASPVTEQSAIVPASDVTPHRPRPLQILLVEDHLDTSRVLTRLLSGSGYHVRTADTVRAALAAADAEPVDLVVSDLGLPDGTGFELMRQLTERHHLLKGIALSGFGTEQDVQLSREAGFVRHLTKPVDFRVLEEAIEAVAC